MKKIGATETTPDQGTSWTRLDKATAEPVGRRLTWRPILAGMLEILASAPYFVASAMFYLFPTKVQVGSITYGSGETTPVIMQVWAPAGLVVWLPFALPLVVGGICALFRKGWDLALLGPIVPLVLTAISLAWGHLGLTAFGSLFVFGWVPAMAVRWAIVAAFFAMYGRRNRPRITVQKRIPEAAKANRLSRRRSWLTVPEYPNRSFFVDMVGSRRPYSVLV